MPKQTNKQKVENQEEQDLSIVKSSQVYSKQVFDDFANFTVKSNKSMVVIYVCSVIILISSIVMFVAGDITSGVIYILLGLFFLFYGQLIKFLMRINNKKNYNTTDYYEFGDDSLKVVCKDATGVEVSTSNVLYSRLYNVKKYKNYGYIYLNKAVAYIVCQENFKDVVEFNFVLNKIENAINQEKINDKVEGLKNKNK